MPEHHVTYSLTVKELAPSETAMAEVLNGISSAAIAYHAENDVNAVLVSASVTTRQVGR